MIAQNECLRGKLQTDYSINTKIAQTAHKPFNTINLRNCRYMYKVEQLISFDLSYATSAT